MSTLSLCLFVLLFVCSVIDADNVVQVKKVSDSELHPESLELQIQMPDDDETAVLELKREDKFNRMPLTISENKRQSRMSSNMLNLNSFGHYRNVKKRAAFAVRRNADGSAEFSGHFKHKRHVYSVSKIDKNHLVKKAEEYPGLNDFEEEDDESDIELSKRQLERGATTNTVELRLLLDNTVYDFFKNRHNSEREALSELQFYYSYILNAIDVVYRNVIYLSISVECIDVFIAKTESDATWMKDVYGDGHKILNNLQVWVPNSTVKADVFMAFTKIDFKYNDNYGVVGLAYPNTTCTTSGVSINEDHGLNCWSTAAHELGHTLGSNHDDGTSCKDKSYIMSANLPLYYTKQNLGDAYQLSTCSINSISNYINGLNPNCLIRDDGTRSRDYITSAHPGSRWTADEICKLFNPSSAGHYKFPGENEDSVCHEMKCLNMGGNRFKKLRFAPVGTICGDGKVCTFNGKCEPYKTSCLPGWKKHASSCYKVLTSTYKDYVFETYDQAKAACHTELPGSHLPILKSKEDADFYKILSIPNCNTNFDYKRIWLGAKRVNGIWKWGEEGEGSNMGMGQHADDENGYGAWDIDQPEKDNNEDRVQLFILFNNWHSFTGNRRLICGVVCQTSPIQDSVWNKNP